MGFIVTIAVLLGIIALFLVAVTIFTPSWHWPVGFMVTIGTGLVSLLLFGKDDGPGGGLGLAFLTFFSLGFAGLAAIFGVGLVWWHRR
jgi:hypothetical protein